MFTRRKQALLFAAASVCALYILGCSNEGIGDAFSRNFVPEAPTDVYAAASADSITVSWSKSSYVTEYCVYRNGSSSKVGCTSDTSYTDKGLDLGTTYYYTVSASNDGGESSKSYSSNSVVTAPRALRDNDVVSASASSSSSINISWPSVPGADGYKVYQSTSSSGNYDHVGNTLSTPSASYASYTVNGLSPGTTYYYKVSAYNNAGDSPKSSQLVSATTKLDKPSDVLATVTSTSSITVTWSSVNGATGYRVYRSLSSSGTYTLMKDTLSTSYTDIGLSPATTYYYTVIAYKGTVVSESASASANTGLNSPTNVSATATSTSSITVRWSQVEGADGYRVRRGLSSSNINEVITTTPSASYTDNGLSPGITYYYTVTAYKGTVESGRSTSVSATTSIDAPTGVDANSLSSSSITVSWYPVDGAAGYRVYRSTNFQGPYNNPVGIVSSSYTSYTDNNVSVGTTYYYTVTAYTSNKESAQSTPPVSGEIRPNPPTGVSATVEPPNSIRISWSPVSGATSYSVYRSTSSSGNYIIVGTSSSTSFTDNGLQSGTYYYKVSAYIGTVLSAQSTPTAPATIVDVEEPGDEPDDDGLGG